MKRAFVVVKCIILVLVCGNAARSQAIDPLQGFRAGHYEGRALNTTANQRGKVTFDLYGLDAASGRVRAYFGASDGLEGEAWLYGKVDKRGELELSGPLASYRMEIRGRVGPRGTINANYKLEGTRPQQGNFE